MYFLALSHAPPPLFRKAAIRMPTIVPTMRHAGDRLGADADLLESEADGDGEPDDERPGTIMLAQGAHGHDVDARARSPGNSVPSMMPGRLLELAAHFGDDRLGRLRTAGHRERREPEHEHRAEQARDEDLGLREVDCEEQLRRSVVRIRF